MKEIFYLGFFLALISAVAAGILAATYTLTADRIASDKRAEIEAAQKIVLAGAQGAVVQVSSEGYAGTIEMLVGINDLGQVAGVKITRINETPGLGSRAADPKFLEQFRGKTIKDKIEVKSDIQAITGATITSRAVSVGVKKALREFKDRKAQPK